MIDYQGVGRFIARGMCGALKEQSRSFDIVMYKLSCGTAPSLFSTLPPKKILHVGIPKIKMRLVTELRRSVASLSIWREHEEVYSIPPNPHPCT